MLFITFANCLLVTVSAAAFTQMLIDDRRATID